MAKKKRNDWDKVVEMSKNNSYNYDNRKERFKSAAERYSIKRFSEEYEKAHSQGSRIVTDTNNGKPASQKQISDYTRSVNALKAFYNDDVFEKYYDEKERSAIKRDIDSFENATFRKYYEDYMNTSDYQNSSYDQKQQYLDEQAKAQKKNIFEKGLDYVSSALMNSAAVNMYQAAPTKANQAAAMQASDKLADSVNDYSSAKLDYAAKSLQRANASEDIYSGVKSNKDFAEISKKDASIARKDSDYRYINGNKSEKLAAKAQAVRSGGSSSSNSVLFDEMNKEQIAIYNYIYKTEGKKEAKKYLNALAGGETGLKASASNEQMWKDLTEKSPVTMEAIRLMSMVPEGIGSGIGAVAGLTGNKTLEHAMYQPSIASGIINRTIENDIDEWSKNENKPLSSDIVVDGQNFGNIYTNAYKFTDSAARSAIASLMLGGNAMAAFSSSAAGGRVAQALINVPISMAAYGAEYNQARQNGLSDFEAKKSSFVNAGIEWTTEVLGGFFGKEFDGFLGSINNEALEEITGDIMQLGYNVLDSALSGKKNNIQLEYEELIEKGKSAKEAIKIILARHATEEAITYIGTALSMIPASGTYLAQQHNAYSHIGKDIQSGESSLTDLATLLSTASSLDENTKSYKTAEKLVKKKSVSNADIGELYAMVSEDTVNALSNAKDTDELSSIYKKLSTGNSNTELDANIAKAYLGSYKKLRAAESENSITPENTVADYENEATQIDSNDSSQYNGVLTTSANTENIPAITISDNNSFNIPVMHNGNKTVITNVAATHNGDITFKTENGESVSLNDVSLPGNSIAAIVNDAATFGTSGASVYIKNATEKSMNNSSYRAFAELSQQMYNLGVVGSPWNVINKQVSPMINALGYSTAKAFYDAGVADNKVLNTIRESKKRAIEKAKKTVQRTSEGNVKNETDDAGLDKVFKAVAEHLHININYVADGGVNGSFNPDTATLTIVQGAKRGDATTLAHEIGEYARAYNYEAYKQYVDTIINYLFEIDAVSTEQDIMAYYRTYHADVDTTTIQDAKEELVNDVTARLFFAEGGIEQIVQHISENEKISVKEKKTFLETLKEIINKIVDVIKKYVTDNNLSASEKAVGNMSLNDVKQLRSQFLDVIDGAIANLENGVEISSSKKFSIKEDSQGFYVDIDTSQNIFEGVSDKDSIKLINKFMREHFKGKIFPLSDNTLSYVGRMGINEYTHPARKNIDTEIYNGKLRAGTELDNLLAVSVFDSHTDDDGHHPEAVGGWDNYKTYYKISNKFYEGFVRIENRANGREFKDITKIKEINRNVGQSAEAPADAVNLFNNNISDSNENVKKSLDVDTDGNKLSAEQQEYFADSKVRDENGNLQVVYHGTNNREETDTWDKTRKKWNTEYKPFTKFKTPEWVDTKGFFFTDNQDNAGGYGSTLYSVYLNIKNPLIIDCNGQNYSNIKFKGLEHDTYEWAEYAKENGYDGVIFNNVIDGAGYEYFEKPVNEFVVFESNQIKSTNNFSPTDNEDIRFSLDVPVEETKDLIAVHNLHTTDLKKAFELGGMPMPSIAIVKAKQGHNNYGEISLVADKSTIDPEANKYNKVYGGDAYTPTYPSVEYELNNKKADSVYKKANDLLGYASAAYNRSVMFAPENIQDALNRSGLDGFVEQYKNDYNTKQLYLLEKGEQPVEMQKKEIKTTISDTYAQLYEHMLSSMKEELMLDSHISPNEWLDNYRDVFDNAYSEYLKKAMPGITDEQIGNVLDSMRPRDKIFLRQDIKKYFQNGKTTVKTENDISATRELINSKIDNDDYDKWFNELFDGIVGKKGVVIPDADPYTRSGDRKPFWATHYEENLENVVRVMRKMNNGDGAFQKNIESVAHREYNSIADIKNDSDRLYIADESEYEEMQDEHYKIFWELANAVKPSNDNGFLAIDNASSVLIEAVRNYKTETGALKYIQQYNPNVNYKLVEELFELADSIANMPTGYFEAKPQRAVKMEEWKAAIIPKNTDSDIKQKLTDYGIQVLEYNGSNSDRVEKLNSLDELKFSRDVEYDNKKSLIKQNKKLQESVEYYRMMLGRNSGHKVNRKQIRQYAAELKKTHNSTMSIDDIAASLTEIFDYISSGNASWGTIELMGKTFSRDLVESAKKEILPENQEVLNYLKGCTISIDDFQRKEIKYAYGDMRNWLNVVRRCVKYSVKDGVPLDIAWQELGSKYPYLFDPETNSNDQPLRLYEVIESLYDTTYNDYGYTDEELAESIMLDIYDKYFDIPEIVTPLDRADRKLHQERAKNKQRLNAVKQADKTRYDKKVKEIKEYYQEMNARLRTNKNKEMLDKLAKQRAKYEGKEKRLKDTRERSRLRDSIRKQLNKILSLASNPTKEKHIPNAIVESVKALAESVTLDGTQYDEKLKTKLANFREGFEEIQSDTQYSVISELYNDYIQDKIIDINNRYGNATLKELPVEALREIDDLIKMTAQSINNINRLFNKERNATIEGYAEKVVTELDTLRKTKIYDGRIKSLFYNTMKPEYFFEYLGSNAMSELYHDLRNGEDIWAVDITEASKFAVDVRKKHNYSNWDFNATHDFESVDGTLTLTLQEVLGIYANSLGEHTRKNLLGGGFVYQTEERKGIKRLLPKNNDNGNHRLSLENVIEIVSSLTDEQKAYVRDMMKYLSSEMGAKGNEVARELYGVELFKEEMYYPAIINKDSRHQSSKEIRADKKIKNAGFTNAIVPEAKQPIVLKNFDDVWATHVDEMSKYHAFALPMENIDRVYNLYSVNDNKYSSTKEAIKNAHGTKAISYIDDLIEDINGGVVQEAGTDIVSWGMSKFKKNAVFASMSVVVQQPSGIGRALSEIDAKYFVATTGSGFNRKTYAEMKKYAPITAIKEMGYFDTNMAQSTIDFLNSNEYEGLMQKAKAFVVDGSYRDEAMSFLAAKADEITWTHIWNACKKEAKENNPKSSNEDICKIAAKKFTDVIAKTQVYDSVFSRSGLMRSNDNLVKNAMAFMAEPTTAINMLGNAIIQAKRGNMSKSKAARVLGSLVATSMLNSLLQSVITAARADGDDDDWKEVYLAQLVPNFIDNLNPVTQIGFLKDIISIFKGYDVSRSDMNMFVDLYTAFQNMHNDNVSTSKKITGLVGAMGAFFGIPAKNILRDIEAAKNVCNDFIDEKVYSRDNTNELFKEEMNSALGFDLFVTSKDKRFEKLYDALIKGDKDKYDKVYKELQNTGLDDDKMNSGLKSAIVDYDIRAAEAALAYNDGNLDKYISYINEFVEDGFDEELVKQAVSAYNEALEDAKSYKDEGDNENYEKKLQELLNSGADKTTVESAIDKIAIEDNSSDEEKQLYKWDDIHNALENGYSSAYKQMYQNALETKIANGKAEADAKKEIKSKIQSYYRQEYIDDPSKRSSIEGKLNTTGLFTQSDYDEWVAASYNTESMKKAFESGLDSTRSYIAGRVDAKVKNGMEKDSAEYGIRQSISNAYKQEYMNGNADTRAKILKYMLWTGLYGNKKQCKDYADKYWLK